MVQNRYRRIAAAALAVFFVVVGGLSGTAFASPDGAGRSEDAPGQSADGGPAPAAIDVAASASAVAKSALADGGASDAPAVASHQATVAAPAAGDGDGPGGQECDGSMPTNNDGGANNDGDDNAYHNTCDAGPSENGLGDGAAVGKPCAGCVGNADDKNPPGQGPDGSDGNRGYECDDNPGVGVGNPAHTPCEPEPSTPEDPADDPDDPDDPADDPDDPAIVAAAVQVTSGAPAEVLGVQLTRAAETVPALARTGTDSIVLVRLATVLLLAGVALVGLTYLRRPRSAS